MGEDIPGSPLLLVHLGEIGVGRVRRGRLQVVGGGHWAEVRGLRRGVRQGQGFRGGLFAGSVLGDGEGLGCVSAHGGGGGAGGASEGAGGQGRLADGDRRGKHPDLLVGGLLDGALELSHLIHCHVWISGGNRVNESSEKEEVAQRTSS